jgi:hypothetical protein
MLSGRQEWSGDKNPADQTSDFFPKKISTLEKFAGGQARKRHRSPRDVEEGPQEFFPTRAGCADYIPTTQG